MYDAIQDPYCYEDTDILKNIPGLRDKGALEAFETVMTAQRAEEPLPEGNFDVSHYQNIHKHFFQDVYEWAGLFRTIRISKGGYMFCYPEHIESEMERVFDELARNNYLRDLSAENFSREAAHFLADINAVHPFREGNGRIQNTFLALLAETAGHPLDLTKLDPKRFLNAMIESAAGTVEDLIDQIRTLSANNAVECPHG